MKNKYIIIIFLLLPSVLIGKLVNNLIYLAEKNNVTEIVSLLQQGADVNQVDAEGFTALHIAAWNGNEDLTRVLLEYGANPNITTKSGSTPIRFTTPAISNILILYGAYAPKETSTIPQFINSTNIYIQHLIPTKPIPIVAKPIGVAPTREPVTKVVSNFITKIVNAYPKISYKKLSKMSLEDVVRIYSWDFNGNNSLHRASQRGDFDRVTNLIHGGVNPFSLNNNQDSALRFAVESSNTQLIKYLVESVGLDINAVNKQGNAPIVYAAIENQADIIKYLISMGANVNSPAFAEVVRIVDGVEQMTTVSNWTPLMAASQLGNNEAIRALLDNGAHINSLDSANWSALLFAAQNGHIDTAKLLVNYGINYNVESSDSQTALSLAIDNGDEELIKYLESLNAANSSIPKVQYNTSYTESVQEVDVEDYEDYYSEEEYGVGGDYGDYGYGDEAGGAPSGLEQAVELEVESGPLDIGDGGVSLEELTLQTPISIESAAAAAAAEAAAAAAALGSV